MTKLIRPRVEVPADDDATTEAVQTELRGFLRSRGNMNTVGAPGLLDAPVIFWTAADVKRGPEERPNARGTRVKP